MPAFTRATVFAAVALVAVAGAGGVYYLTSSGPGGPGGPITPPPATALPTASTTAQAGIPGWRSYMSEVYSFNIRYPSDWSVHESAVREWRAGDDFPSEAMPFAEAIISPGEGDETIGIFAWEMPAEGGDLGSWEGLRAWAETFCSEIGGPSCETFDDATTPMCNTDGGRECEAAIIVRTAGPQFAIFRPWVDAILGIERVRVVVVGREDSHPSAARYGGSVELLESTLAAMGVLPPRPGQTPD
jgi:hypothetical protein